MIRPLDSGSEPVCAEVALSRVLGYLRMSGMKITPAVERQALAVVMEALDQGPDEPFGASMALARERFHLGFEVAVAPAPPIRRGSIGYGAH